MNNADRLKQQVPDFISGTEIMNDIYNAHGKELDLLEQYNADIVNQLFVETATWGLSFWEEFFGLPVLINQDIDIRRAKIRAHFASFGTVNKATIRKIAKEFGFNGVDVVEDYAPYIVKLIFDNSDTGKDVNINDLISTLRKMCPAHVDFMYIFLYKSWKDIHNSNMTFTKMDSYQWKDYTTDFDTSTKTTPILGMKVWEDGDLFSMKGFNYNFDRIDTITQRHTHDGIDSPKIVGTNILYSNAETNSDIPTALTRLNNKIKAQDKQNMKQIWGYNKTSDKWADVTQFCYDTNIKLVAAIRKKGVDIPDGAPLNRLSLYIDNIFTGLTPQGTAKPEHVREGKTFINANGVSTGTAKYRTGTITPGTSDIDISGYVDNLTIKGDANLKAANIKNTASLWNVRGTLADAKYPNEAYLPKDCYTTSGIRDFAKWANTNRKGQILCMEASDYVLLGGTDLRIYDKETGQPYSIISSSSLLKAIGYDESSPFKDNMRVTHITRCGAFIYQDVVLKNRSYLIELGTAYRGMTVKGSYSDYVVSLEKTYSYQILVGFKKQIITYANNKTYTCKVYGEYSDDEIIPNGVVSTNSSGVGTVYYITKNTKTGATTLHYSFRDGSYMWGKSIAELYPKLTNPEATCIEFDGLKQAVLIGVNDKTKLVTSGGSQTYTNYAHIGIIDSMGYRVKDVDFSDGSIVNPDYPEEKYRLTNITSLKRRLNPINITEKDGLITATFLPNGELNGGFDSIEIDGSINIKRHMNQIYFSYGTVTAGMYYDDSLYTVVYNNLTANGMKNMPMVVRIQRTPKTCTITK